VRRDQCGTTREWSFAKYEECNFHHNTIGRARSLWAAPPECACFDCVAEDYILKDYTHLPDAPFAQRGELMKVLWHALPWQNPAERHRVAPS
jgi:hypothetical protein